MSDWGWPVEVEEGTQPAVGMGGVMAGSPITQPMPQTVKCCTITPPQATLSLDDSELKFGAHVECAYGFDKSVIFYYTY